MIKLQAIADKRAEQKEGDHVPVIPEGKAEELSESHRSSWGGMLR